MNDPELKQSARARAAENPPSATCSADAAAADASAGRCGERGNAAAADTSARGDVRASSAGLRGGERTGSSNMATDGGLSGCEFGDLDDAVASSDGRLGRCGERADLVDLGGERGNPDAGLSAKVGDRVGCGPIPSIGGGGPRVGLIVGPTGAGKTAFAVELAERLGAEIVNADSRQLYRRMDLGTAKPNAADRARVTHHLIDVCDPDLPIDVADFAARAHEAIAGIAARGRPVLIVGGSGLYLRVLRGGIFAGPPASPEYRAELGALAAAHGAAYLHDRLKQADLEAALRISVNDLPRIIRALEVYALSGIPISEHQRRHGWAAGGYENLAIGLAVARERLYDRIDRRFDEMIKAGLVAEVRGLLAARVGAGRAHSAARDLSAAGGRAERSNGDAGADRGVGAQRVCEPVASGAGVEGADGRVEAGGRVGAGGAGSMVMQTIGYRELARYLEGTLELGAAIELAKRESRRLAKRQMTWFRRERDVVWLDPDRGIDGALNLFREFLHPRA